MLPNALPFIFVNLITCVCLINRSVGFIQYGTLMHPRLACVSFPMLGNFSSSSSSNIFLGSFSLLPLSRTLIIQMLVSLTLSRRSLRLSSSLFLSSFCPAAVISTNLFSAHLFVLLLHLFCYWFHLVYFSFQLLFISVCSLKLLCVLVTQSCPSLCDPHRLQPSRLLRAWDFLAENTGSQFPSPGDLPNPGMEPRSPTLQVGSLLSEPPGMPKHSC